MLRRRRVEQERPRGPPRRAVCAYVGVPIAAQDDAVAALGPHLRSHLAAVASEFKTRNRVLLGLAVHTPESILLLANEQHDAHASVALREPLPARFFPTP